jgi:hypothetical protein
MIEWYSRPELRDCNRVGLNKLTRAVFYHECREIRADPSGARLSAPPASTWWSVPSSCGTPPISRAVEAVRESRLSWPPRAIGFRLIDREGQEVFARDHR